jgi:hypothetical protein
LAVGDDGVPAELGHADLKRDPRPQARLFEKHREALALEKVLLFAADLLEGLGRPEQATQLIGGEVEHRQHVASTQAPGRRHRQHCIIIHPMHIDVNGPRPGSGERSSRWKRSCR